MGFIAGDTAYVCVTDHPDFPQSFHVGDSYLWEDEETAKRIAAAWNALDQDGWTWYVKPVVLLPPRAEADERQETLWEY